MMNEKFQINLEGKILEVIKPANKCFVKINCNSFLIDIPCPENCDFRLEDNVILKCELIVNQITSKEEINQQTNKMEVQDER